MKQLSLFICLLVAHTSFCQQDSLQKEINTQVWKPFIRAFIEYDTEGFMAVHSREMTRVLQDGNMVQTYDQYQQGNKRSDDRSKLSNRKRNIELRFIQRIAGNGRAFEVGYFKTSTITPDGVARSFYGKFHVLLRKENGLWKILMDADAASDTDETGFNGAMPLE